jgi:hypothetical protein
MSSKCDKHRRFTLLLKGRKGEEEVDGEKKQNEKSVRGCISSKILSDIKEDYFLVHPKKGLTFKL